MEMTCMKCNKVVEVNKEDKYPTLTDQILDGFYCEDCRAEGTTLSKMSDEEFDAHYDMHLDELADFPPEEIEYKYKQRR